MLLVNFYLYGNRFRSITLKPLTLFFFFSKYFSQIQNIIIQCADGLNLTPFRTNLTPFLIIFFLFVFLF